MLKGGEKDSMKISKSKQWTLLVPTPTKRNNKSFLEKWKNSRVRAKNVLPGTFSITRKQQSYQNLIGVWQTQTKERIWASKRIMTKTDGNTQHTYKNMWVHNIQRRETKNKNHKMEKSNVTENTFITKESS